MSMMLYNRNVTLVHQKFSKGPIGHRIQVKTPNTIPTKEQQGWELITHYSIPSTCSQHSLDCRLYTSQKVPHEIFSLIKLACSKTNYFQSQVPS